jgi:hypothetical protein
LMAIFSRCPNTFSYGITNQKVKIIDRLRHVISSYYSNAYNSLISNEL